MKSNAAVIFREGARIQKEEKLLQEKYVMHHAIKEPIER